VKKAPREESRWLSNVSHPLSVRLMNLKPASRIAIRAAVKAVRAIWHA
jgi:hypothetical protein